MKVKELIVHQVDHVRKDGLAVLFKKVKTLLNMGFKFLVQLIIVILYSPLYILLLLVSPVVFIRIGEIESRAIGHFSLPIEIYLAEQKMGLHASGRKHFDIWFINKKISNAVLLEKWRRYFTIIPAFIIEPLFHICRWAPGGKNHRVPYRHWLDRNANNKFWQVTDIHDVLDKVEPMVNFSPSEISEAQNILSSIGVSDTDNYVCFNARNPGYLAEAEFGPRDSSINSQFPAMLALANAGYKAIRVGSVVSEKLDDSPENIIDYSTSGKRSELLDLYLISKCKFMVSTGSGIDCIATIFRRPAVYVNICDFGNCQAFNGKYLPLFIPKKFMSDSNQKIMSFSEVYENEVDLFANTERFKAAGLHWLDNTGDEVKDVVMEMESRVNGNWTETEEDIVLQKKFWDIFSKYRGTPPPYVRVGASFLRQNQHLLQ